MRISRSLRALPLALILTTGIAVADCTAGCPSLPSGGSTSNVGSSTTSNNVNGVSNPSAAIINQNENFQQQGQVQYGGGIACADNTINPYIGNTNVGGAGYGYNALTYGIGASISIGPNHARCAALAQQVLTQKTNDTLFGTANACITLAHNAEAIGQNPNTYIAAAGLGSTCPPVVIVAPPPVVVQAPPVVMTKVVTYVEPCVYDAHAASDLAEMHARRHELRTFHPSAQMVNLEAKLSHACGVTPAQIVQALDG